MLTIAYLVSSVLFILSLRGLSNQETARRGNLLGVVGMAIAVGATATDERVQLYYVLVPALLFGAAIGWRMASRVAMTAMPELVALLHSFVGLAAVLVGFASYLDAAMYHDHSALVFLVEVFLDVVIGAITFAGSVVAWAKLSGRLSGRPLLLPARHALNLVLLGTIVGLGVLTARTGVPVADDGTIIALTSGLVPLLIAAGLACVLGVHLVAAIGGADMPVVVSMLNSYSGWTAAAAGFMLSNDLLIVTGALVGSSGAILSYIMCRAMNRSIWSVIFGGFGTEPGAPAAPRDPSEQGDVVDIDVPALVDALVAARDVVIVPGYGMAVARAQFAVDELTRRLRARGVRVRFGIHPVAGRLPGHMNVLLAEANVPYDIVFEMDELNHDFDRTDVVLVIGANDIVNPGAIDDPGSPIYGMPVLHVWEAALTVVFKRSRATGYAGVDNPLFYHERTRMLFGDAKETVDALVSDLSARPAVGNAA